ncbi:undecaprenyldiphospho-muramoylpentapeptide beta-N-acetylglucosaminyltransferase [bacterium]|nr:undecaprenyldiphospho-muramoylpentapeptide beta-N-acetylglucosaminyltransferase [bacterium]
MKVVLTGGGTGGHVFPALAIAEALRECDSTVKLHYIGTATGFEAQAVPQSGIDFHDIRSSGVIGRSKVAQLVSLAQVSFGIVQSLRILSRIGPDAVVGTGGYVMAPVLVAARLLRIPYYLQEQNSFPGYTTRKFASGAAKVFVGFPAAERHLSQGNLLVTGNPIRSQMLSAQKSSGNTTQVDKNMILITGGSLGAKSINDAVAAALRSLCQLGLVAWQYGKTGLPKTVNSDSEELTQSGKLIAAPFFADMPDKLKAARIVVCRSGAMTLSEISTFGVPAVLIPFPHSANDHQSLNAQYFVDHEAALVIRDDKLDADSLSSAVTKILADRVLYEKMSSSMRLLSKPDAAKLIATTVLSR